LAIKGLSPVETRGEAVAGETSRPFRALMLNAVSFRTIGALYILIILGIYFSLTTSTFAEVATIRQILNGQAVAALSALALLLPLSAGIFDLSIAYTMSFTGILSAHLMVHERFSLWAAIVITLVTATAIGAVNGLVVIGLRIDSFIGTLATGALIQAINTMISHDNSITSPVLYGGFAKIAQTSVGGFTLPIAYALVVAIALWYVQERTATGRRLFAIGFNRDAARLAGVSTERHRFATLMVSSTLAGFAGIVLASSIGSGSSDAGTPYLLISFAATFLGATQFKRGRFNAAGTILALLLLGTGTVGLALKSAEQWAQSLFTGLVLIAALTVTNYERRRSGGSPVTLRRAPNVTQQDSDRAAEPETRAPQRPGGR